MIDRCHVRDRECRHAGLLREVLVVLGVRAELGLAEQAVPPEPTALNVSVGWMELRGLIRSKVLVRPRSGPNSR